MRTIGLVGGMTWKSTQDYYRILNEEINHRLGGHHSARIVLYSLEFAEVEKLEHAGDWDAVEHLMVDAAKKVEAAGADILLLCANTIHKVAGPVEDATSMKLIHIADATAAKVKEWNLDKVGLLGTKFVMEEDFIKSKLSAHGIEALVPEELDRNYVHRVIFDELCQGVVDDSSRRRISTIVTDLKEKGARGLVLGCTELPMLLGPGDLDLPLFDTTHIHAVAAVDEALKE